MADVTISYKGAEIASLSASGTKVLQTRGKYCEDDITVSYTAPGGGSTDPNYKRWLYNNAAKIDTTQNVTLLTDLWLAEHYNDADLEVAVICRSAPDITDSANVFFVRTTARNTAVTSGSGYSYCQLGIRAGKSAAYTIVHTTAIAGTNPTNRGMLKLDASGNLCLRVDNNCVLTAGDYEIIARLMPT